MTSITGESNDKELFALLMIANKSHINRTFCMKQMRGDWQPEGFSKPANGKLPMPLSNVKTRHFTAASSVSAAAQAISSIINGCDAAQTRILTEIVRAAKQAMDAYQ